MTSPWMSCMPLAPFLEHAQFPMERSALSVIRSLHKIHWAYSTALCAVYRTLDTSLLGVYKRHVHASESEPLNWAGLGSGRGADCTRTFRWGPDAVPLRRPCFVPFCSHAHLIHPTFSFVCKRCASSHSKQRSKDLSEKDSYQNSINRQRLFLVGLYMLISCKCMYLYNT